VRALIVDLPVLRYDMRHNASEIATLDRAAAALEASLPREDADLDAIEAWLSDAWDRGGWDEVGRVVLARVRAAEAERDEARRRLGVIEDSARDGLADSDDDMEMSAYWVFMVATGQDQETTQPRSRTVETAEEWAIEFERRAEDIRAAAERYSGYYAGVRSAYQKAAQDLRQPVPPTPEESDRA
jgi:hypothetical protein